MEIIASIVLYKHSFDDVKKTLNSLFEESKVSLVVVVDNGNNCPWLHDVKNDKLKIVCLSKNVGFGAGHNMVLNSHNFDAPYYLICNPDIYFQKGELDKLFEFSMHNKVGAAIPKVLYPDGSMQYGCRLLPQPYQLVMRRFFTRLTNKINYRYELKDADYTVPFFAPSLSGCFMLVSQKVVRLTNGFDEQFFLYLEDVDLSRRICELNSLILYCPYSTVIHEAQRNSYRNIKFLKFHMVSAFKYFNKWGWFFDSKRTKINQKCLSELPKSLQD